MLQRQLLLRKLKPFFKLKGKIACLSGHNRNGEGGCITICKVFKRLACARE